jgi:hypothetical protein
MPEAGNALSRNPNICASCSSLADGMEESTESENISLAPGQELTPRGTEALDRGQWQASTAEFAAHQVSK